MTSNATAFCIGCSCETPYTVSSSRETITIRGLTFSYVELHAHCGKCGEPIYVPEINDENVASREEGYRKEAKLITVAEVNELLDKYNIGAGPLARLLGFGEITINRYVSGQLPSRDHSDILLKVKSSRKTMEEYLEAGKDLISPVAYTKCRAAINEINDLYGNGRIERIARYFLCRISDITPLALQKLLYFAQAFYKAIFSQQLFPETCQAWRDGPVYPDIYYKYKEFGYNPIDKPTKDLDEDLSELTTRELSLLDAVIDVFGSYSGTVLSNITHNELPWLEARGSLLPEDRSTTVIKQETIESYFRAVVEKYQIISPRDIRKYCEAMVNQ